MKTNKMIAAWLAATAIMTLSFGYTFAMWGENWMGNWGWKGKLLQYVTDEEKAEIQKMDKEKRQTYMEKLKEKYNITDNDKRWKYWKMWGESHRMWNMISDIPSSDLNDIEKELLSYWYSEELLARDVYKYLADLYPEQEVFSKISWAEQKHADAVKVLLDRYDLDVPTGYGDLQSTYDALISEWSKSLKDALEVGLKIEVLDINDIEKSISETDNDDFKIVFTNIWGASYNHMRGFLKAFESNGLIPSTDISDFLSSEDLDVKWPLKYKLAERLESKWIELPVQVSSETMKSKWSKWNNHWERIERVNHWKRWERLNHDRKWFMNNSNWKMNNNWNNNSALINKYKNAYEVKYGSLIKKMNNSQLETFIGKVDVIIEKVNTWNYSPIIKDKYNSMLIALKELATDNLDGDNLLEGLFN